MKTKYCLSSYQEYKLFRKFQETVLYEDVAGNLRVRGVTDSPSVCYKSYVKYEYDLKLSWKSVISMGKTKYYLEGEEKNILLLLLKL